MALRIRHKPTRTYKNYKRYKRWLRDDFAYTCAYCELHENLHGGYRNFEIDHHRPKSIFSALINSYDNLIYSCDICNRAKSDIWPSENPLQDGIGWLDPCECDLREHFLYEMQGETIELVTKTRVGKWMALNLAMDHPARIAYYQAKLSYVECLKENIVECRKVHDFLAAEWESNHSNNYLQVIKIIDVMIARNEKQLHDMFEPLHFESISKSEE